MRKHKFRLADMMPNAWFYKLRDMNKARNQIPFHTIKKKLPTPTQIPTNPFKYTQESVTLDTLYNSTKINDPTTKTSKTKPKRKTIYRPSPKKVIPSVSDYFTCTLQPEIVDQVHPCFQDTFLESPSPEFEYFDSSDHYSYDQSLEDKLDSYTIIISKEETPTPRKIEKVAEFDMIITEPTLPRILTKPTNQSTPAASPNFKNKINSTLDSPTVDLSIQPKKTTKTSPPTRKSVSRSRRLKIKNKKIDTCTGTRKSFKAEKKACSCFYSDSFAMVKTSFDPKKDFSESMKEMILENNIQASRELEELLACYLSLNSSQYHDIIIKAFEQLWFTMPISI